MLIRRDFDIKKLIQGLGFGILLYFAALNFAGAEAPAPPTGQLQDAQTAAAQGGGTGL